MGRLEGFGRGQRLGSCVRTVRLENLPERGSCSDWRVDEIHASEGGIAGRGRRLVARVKEEAEEDKVRKY